MAWKITGQYVASCTCNVLCPCPVDGVPSDPAGKGECRGTAVFRIDSGNMDDVDLSGATFGLVNFFSGQPSKGDWKIGVVIDEGASDPQADALQKVVSGEAGGPFADFAPLIGENLGAVRGTISVSDTAVSVSGMSEFSYEPLRGADGEPTTVKNAALGFVPEFQVGRSSGHTEMFGISFDGNYGESGAFEYSSEGHEHIRA